MHWIGDAATRAGFEGAAALQIPDGTSVLDAWEIGARDLGTTPSELATRIAPTFRLHTADFLASESRAIRLVPASLARRYAIFPLRDTDRQLFVATADPGNLECEQNVAFASGRRVTFELAPPHLIAQAIDRAYASDVSANKALSQLDNDLTDAVRVIEETKPEAVAANDVESAPVVKLTNLILRDAVLQRASDIHIEPGDGGGAVRFRVDGVMRQYMQLPMAALNRVVSRIKVISKLDIADRMRPQDGRTRLQIEGRTVDVRVSTVPIRDSEKVVMRVLRPDSGGVLEDAGLAAPELIRLRQLLRCRDGIVLVTGPTGSGKTTTMYGALRELATGDVNIMTVEDPVEYELSKISQMQIDPKRGVTFASALRAILRQDPDVIFVGEIRDLETAEIAVQAAMTGHLVLATLHTNDAVSAVARLVDLGLDRAAISATVRGSLAQRLVRKICGECAQHIGTSLTPEEARLSATFSVKPMMRPMGCGRCGGTGYYGRLPVDEVAVFSPAMLEQVAQGASTQSLQKLAVANGMRTLRTNAAERVALGQTSLSELERVVGDVAPGEVAPAEKPADAGPAILVVDDDPVQRLLVATTLERNGFRVMQAEDGEAALERLASGAECALLLTDLHMPKLNGDELVRRVRANKRTAALPIVVLTGSSEADRESELIDIGADDYIRKPVDPPRLLARVRAALRRAS